MKERRKKAGSKTKWGRELRRITRRKRHRLPKEDKKSGERKTSKAVKSNKKKKLRPSAGAVYNGGGRSEGMQRRINKSISHR